MRKQPIEERDTPPAHNQMDGASTNADSSAKRLPTWANKVLMGQESIRHNALLAPQAIQLPQFRNLHQIQAMRTDAQQVLGPSLLQLNQASLALQKFAGQSFQSILRPNPILGSGIQSRKLSLEDGQDEVQGRVAENSIKRMMCDQQAAFEVQNVPNKELCGQEYTDMAKVGQDMPETGRRTLRPRKSLHDTLQPEEAQQQVEDRSHSHNMSDSKNVDPCLRSPFDQLNSNRKAATETPEKPSENSYIFESFADHTRQPRVRRTRPDHEINARIDHLVQKNRTDGLEKAEEDELKRLKSLMASRIHRDKKADEKQLTDGKLNQSERNETIIRSLNSQISVLKDQVHQGLAREHDWKKREQRWETRESAWNAEREQLLKIIAQQSEKQAPQEKGVAARRDKKASEKAEAIVKRNDVSRGDEERQTNDSLQ